MTERKNEIKSDTKLTQSIRRAKSQKKAPARKVATPKTSKVELPAVEYLNSSATANRVWPD